MEAPQNNLRIEPPCDPAASPLGVDPKERKSGPQRYTCSIIHRNKMEIVQVSSNEAMSLMFNYCPKAMVNVTTLQALRGWVSMIFRPCMTYEMSKIPKRHQLGAIKQMVKWKPSANFSLLQRRPGWRQESPGGKRELLKGDKGRERKGRSHPWRSHVILELAGKPAPSLPPRPSHSSGAEQRLGGTVPNSTIYFYLLSTESNNRIHQ